MPLPSIVMPASVPAWLAAGADLELGTPFVSVPVCTGHPRRRRVTTGAEHRVNVELHLNATAAAAFDTFFEEDLEAGALRFAARVHGTEAPDLQWWDALFLAPPTWTALGSGDGTHWLVTATLHLRGEPSNTAP